MTDDITNMEIVIRPIGFVRCAIKKPFASAECAEDDIKGRMEKIRERNNIVKELVSELVISPDFGEEIFEGIEEFSHILVLYWPHLLPPERRNLKQVHPLGRKDLPKRGIFATCSPARPNSVLVSAVRLLSRDKNILKVKGFEAVDGSPIIDIKPYVQTYHGAENPKVPGWMQKIRKELDG